MKEIIADIFTVHGQPGQWVWKICPTNGDTNKDGLAVMGAGIAKDLANDYPKVKQTLGQALLAYGNKPVPMLVDERNCMWWSFPVKHHWNEKANMQLITLSLIVFKRILYEREDKRGPDFVVFPRVGCGNGKLDWERNVRPLMHEAFEKDDRIVVVSLPF